MKQTNSPSRTSREMPLNATNEFEGLSEAFNPQICLTRGHRRHVG